MCATDGNIGYAILEFHERITGELSDLAMGSTGDAKIASIWVRVDSNDPIKISFEVPSQLEESSIEDDTPRQHDNDNTPTVATYEVIKDGSQKGKEKLADSEGLHLYYQGTDG